MYRKCVKTKVINYLNPFQWFLIFAMIIANYLVDGFTNPLATICSITGVICVVLVGKGSISNYLFGLINVVTYIVISYQSKLYGEVMLNALYYLPIQFIGYYMWKKNIDEKTDVVKSKRMNGRQIVITAIASVLGIIIYALILKYMHGNTPFLDSTSTILSIIAQILMLACFVEQWVLWIIVNVVSVIMWSIAACNGADGGWTMAAMWFMYLISACYGYYNWVKMAKTNV